MDNTYNDNIKQDVESSTPYGQDNANKHLMSNDMVKLLHRVQTLYLYIEQEISTSISKQDSIDDKKIEMWSTEIEAIYARVVSLPAYSHDSLKAKVEINLLMIEKFSVEDESFTSYRENILNAINEFSSMGYDDTQRQVGQS